MSEAGKHAALFGLEKHRWSVASGALACFASVLGKVAFDGDTPFRVRATASCEETFPDLALCNTVGLALQGASLAGMFLVNAVMLSTFLKALQSSGSTVATVTNFATNFLLSGIFGRVVFGESLPPSWFGGASLVVLGVALLTAEGGSGGGDRGGRGETSNSDTKKAGGFSQLPNERAGSKATTTTTRSRTRAKRD